MKLWLPVPEKASTQEVDKMTTLDLDAEMAIFLLTHAGDQFCWMVQTEREAKAEALAAEMEDGNPLRWKRVVQGVREMCDVCETTLFNFHWACKECGYVVCIDCYKTRRAAKSPLNGNSTSGKEDEKEVCLILSCPQLYLLIELNLFHRTRNVMPMVGSTVPAALRVMSLGN